MKQKFQNIYIGFDYGVVLPFFALLPYKMGRFLAKCRGAVYFYLKRDWRSFTFGDDTLHDRAFRGLKSIVTNRSEKEYKLLLRSRYIHQSIEEYEAVLLRKGKFPAVEVEYRGLEAVEKSIAENPHCVFITAHFGNSLAGVSFLEVLGVPVLGMSSDVTKKDMVNNSITKLYDEKYKAIGAKLNGGEVIDIEGNTKKFLKFLKQKGSLIIIADLPPTHHNETPEFREFFGEKRGFASGATKLASSANSKIIAFVSYYLNGKYIMQFSQENQEPYSFLEQEINKRPNLWWASDLLELYPKKESKNEI